MNIQEFIEELISTIQNSELIKATFSNIRNKELELEKSFANLILIKGSTSLQIEYRYKRIIKHKNILITDKLELEKTLTELFNLAKDINIQTKKQNINIKISKKFKLAINRKNADNKLTITGQNKKKSYLLDENKPHAFLIELGIQSKDGKIKKERYSKFRQINKYLEFIDHAVKKLDPKKTIKILDFASGKSYLTFAAYHYLALEKNIKVNIIGIDLKKEVIDSCNEIAKNLNYSGLEFIYGDVADFSTTDEIDMLISLHACDTASDIAILKALKWKVKVFLAVPCCQKEINKQLKEKHIPFMLKHGIIKEKYASLLTDSIRADVLNSYGYKTDIIEFISEDNTPKNMLIRAYKESDFIDKAKLLEKKSYLANIGIEMMLLKQVTK
ncbi:MULTISPECIES: SAM-dependent methyltransferase [unclassified Gemella]|uniref:class I SAM-dependent methyltransferase n=1 Tax=unclassified Gemella TaxID=2624949 RepID=UPI0010730931|nr:MULTISPECIES: SAM-dependent methyltransferase [unclassified Gemella]MBF0709703.1 SAM-dependent methyltransferase [Gemella sp. GL1.1]MBF0746879.1 SAM-dependent methyltransferase [Gemella sp. 19428wG2_WT2a]NYS27047.1 SAM-dependent methyltransferase [Gemella sp. GL1]TFU59109.1 SAM-dependent methyltransferase [Gemella sp. WT2a]